MPADLGFLGIIVISRLAWIRIVAVQRCGIKRGIRRIVDTYVSRGFLSGVITSVAIVVLMITSRRRCQELFEVIRVTPLECLNRALTDLGMTSTELVGGLLSHEG